MYSNLSWPWSAPVALGKRRQSLSSGSKPRPMASVTETRLKTCDGLSATGTAYVLVAELDGQIAGSIIGTFDGWRGHICRLAVHPAFRRRSIACALVRAVKERLIAAGARRIIPLVEKDRPWRRPSGRAWAMF
jgi:ribosomal protein S18 acetylase RimI-like enzyme